jgi:hypothetical protein
LIGGHFFATEPETAFGGGPFSVQGQIIDQIPKARLAFYIEGLARRDIQPTGRVLTPASGRRLIVGPPEDWDGSKSDLERGRRQVLVISLKICWFPMRPGEPDADNGSTGRAAD